MARMSGATWRPLSINHSKGGCRPRLVILHIIVGSLSGADSWFRNSRSRVSAHFGTSRSGELRQWVDTSDRAWANAGANAVAISIENEGKVGDSLTDAQLDRCAEVLAFAHRTHGVALAVTDNPNGSGLAFHSLTPSWSLGGTACPGPKIVAQRAEIVRRAKAIVNGGAAPKPPKPGTKAPAFPLVAGHWFGPESSNPRNHSGFWPGDRPHIRRIRDQFRARGWVGVPAGDRFDARLAERVRAFQTEKGLKRDGVVGPQTWRALWESPIT